MHPGWSRFPLIIFDYAANPNIGKVDTAASTQFLFLYDVSGANKASPVLTQVIQQFNAHVGLVWAPDGQTLYAAGGCDDVVYAYTNKGGSFALSSKIALGHAPNGCGNQSGIGLGVSSNASGLAISADGGTLVAANNYNKTRLCILDEVHEAEIHVKLGMTMK